MKLERTESEGVFFLAQRVGDRKAVIGFGITPVDRPSLAAAIIKHRSILREFIARETHRR